MLRSLALSLFISCLSINVSYAEIFSWVDENGQRHYGDEKPKNTDAEAIKVKPNLSGYKMIDPNLKKSQNQKDISHRFVIMYSTAWCSYCKQARQYLKDNKIQFKEKDIEKSRNAKLEYKKLGGQNVPFFFYKGQTHRGFHPSSFGNFYNSLNSTESVIPQP